MLSTIKSIVPLFLYIVGLVTVIFCLSGRVRFGFLFLIPLLPLQNIFEKFHVFPFGKDFNDILLIGMLVGWLVSKASKRETFLTKSPYNIILFLYFLFTYFTLWMGSMYLNDPAPVSPLDPRVQNWKNYMVLPLIFFLTSNNLKDKRDFVHLIILMCGSILLMNYYNVRQISWMTHWISRTKVTGTFVWLGANEVAAFYATYTFVLAGIFVFIKKKLPKLLLGGLIFVNLYIVLFLFSRAAYLSVFAGALLFCMVRARKWLIPLILVLVFWQVVLPERVIDRVTFSEEHGELDASAQTRLILWEQSMIYFRESPIFGVGFNVFSHLGMKRDAHNVFLRTLAEQGLIGLFFLLFILGLAFQRGWRLYRRSDDPFFKGLGLGFSVCVVAVIVGNSFGDRWTPLPLAAYFWVFLGMVERANRMTGETKRQEVRSKTQDIKTKPKSR